MEYNGDNYFVSGIPSKGYKVIDLVKKKSKVKVLNRSLENLYFKVIFDKNYNIVSVYDKTLKRELLKENKSIKFRAYEDYPFNYDAWDVYRYYKEKEYLVNDIISVEKIIENCRKGLKITRKFVNSIIIDKVYLYDNEKFVGFENEIDWNTEHVFLKREFPIDVITDKATCEIQFGSVERPTHKNTPWEQAKFEVCAHKYVDVSETDFGVAIVNDSKYGYSILDNDIAISLIKCATYPDKEADKGKHFIKYALYPHENAVNNSDVANFAYKFNNNPTAIESNGLGNKESEYSLISCDSDNILIDTIKFSEDGKDVIIRLFDAKRMNKKIIVNLGFNVKEVYLTNLLEKDIEKLTVENNKILLKVKPFEIITLRCVI